jgi:hypothetical protein
MNRTKNLLLFCVFLFPLWLMGQANPLQSKITVDLNEVTLDHFVAEVSQMTGAQFAYNSRDIGSDRKISVKASNETLEQVLNRIAKELHLEYKLVRGQIILKPASGGEEMRRFTLSGHIREQTTGETLPGASVWADSVEAGTISNNYGFYSISLPQGQYTIQWSYVGFSPQKMTIDLSQDRVINVEMHEATQTLKEAVVTVDIPLIRLQTTQASLVSLNPDNLQKLPEFAGEVGLIKSLQAVPGIKTHSDGSAFFFVRGGNKDQNLILIDEAPVYNPAHLFGYYSVIIPDIAQSISIYKGDLPVEKGDRLSSVIDVQTKEGNLKNIAFNGVFNPLMYRFSLEGPIVREKSSFFTSFRHSNFRWIYSRNNPDNNLFFADLNAKFNIRINPRNRVYFAFFYGVDNFTNETPQDQGGVRWFNFTSTLRWNHIFNNRLFSNSTIYSSKYQYTLFTRGTEWISEIGNLSLAYDFTWYYRPAITIKFGGSQTFHEFNPGNLTATEDNPFAPRISRSRGSQTAFYFSGEHKLSQKWSYKAGFRIPIWVNYGPGTLYQFDSLYNVKDTLVFANNETIASFLHFDPRLSLRYGLSKSASVRLSAGVYHQHLHLISNSISPFSSFEIWMPSGPNIKPQRAVQTALGLNKLFIRSGVELSAEAYYKKMYHQIEYVEHANLILNPLIEGDLRFGEASAYGMEFSLRKTEGRLTGWACYTFSRSLSIFPDINQGLEFPAYYDRPHDVSLFLSYRLSNRVNISASWVYYTGSAVTTPVGFYSYDNYTVPRYGEKNNDRLPDYHRLDIALNWMLNKPGNNLEHSLTLGIYNFYNRHNAVSINFNKVETKEGKFVVPANLFGTHEIMTTQKYLLGIMPSLTYRIKI